MAKKASSKNDSGIRPLGDRVLVRPLSGEEAHSATASGIIIPDNSQGEKTDRGEVIAVGPGRRSDDNKLISLEVKEGDKVLFQWGEKVEYGGQEYYLVGENNILAIID